MSRVLLDSSVWITYFRDSRPKVSKQVDDLIDRQNVYTNDLALAELLPFLEVRKEGKVIESLKAIECFPWHMDWEQIVEYQVLNLKN